VHHRGSHIGEIEKMNVTIPTLSIGYKYL
jgi:hypothetical protein